MHVFPDSSVASHGHVTLFCQKDINGSILGELLGKIFLSDRKRDMGEWLSYNSCCLLLPDVMSVTKAAILGPWGNSLRMKVESAEDAERGEEDGNDYILGNNCWVAAPNLAKNSLLSGTKLLLCRALLDRYLLLTAQSILFSTTAW